MTIRHKFPYREHDVLRWTRSKGDSFWARQRETQALTLFHQAAQRIPAYKDFLKKNRITPDKIRTWKDFQLVPPVTKKNYLRNYPLRQLLWDGSLKEPMVFTATSGSTGEPFYFPRNRQLDWQYSIIIEQFLRNSSYGATTPTLVIVGFGMGVWIGGLITYQAYEMATRRAGIPASIITPGVNKEEIFSALKRLAPNFQQVILVGYPPFIKDIIDEAPAHGIDIKKLNLRIMSAAEAYTETFRDYIVQKGGVRNVYRDVLNVYGSADIGAMATETPFTIFTRRLATQHRPFFERVFGSINKTPTLAQYNPLFITFEAVDDEVLLTGQNQLPLVRYAIGDNGGVRTPEEIRSMAEAEGIDFDKAARAEKLSPYFTNLPMVYVYERKNLSTTLYGINIYPEYIRDALMHPKAQQYTTGKFTMITKYDEHNNQRLEINLELKKGNAATNKQREELHTIIVSALRSRSSEFQELTNHIGARAHPTVILWKAEDSTHFKPGIKQRWVKKDDDQNNNNHNK